MVFESLVVELINRYLGDFVENLDTSQLKIGIWGGMLFFYSTNYFCFCSNTTKKPPDGGYHRQNSTEVQPMKCFKCAFCITYDTYYDL